ncbi:MAG: alpha/beta hydrolase-fold protein [Bryobacteraceae bacterium]
MTKFALLAPLALCPLILGQGPSSMTPYRVQPDRSVTFRIAAPHATEVKLDADFLTEPQAMWKNAEGVWSAEVGPLAPAIYAYAYLVDGVRTADPNTPYTLPGIPGASSFIEVRGAEPAFYDPKPVPHGVVHMAWYQSQAIGGARRVYVYTPPGYEAAATRYPVLYLLHGVGDIESSWVDVGHANLILDNLIAEKKARPMIVVMPFGHARAQVAVAQPPFQLNDTELFQQDLIESVIPLIESTYRAAPGAENRAIAGLSMGGAQAADIGLSRLDLFRWIGAFSPSLFASEDWDAVFAKILPDPEAANRKLKLLWISCGKSDELMGNSKRLDAALTKHGIHHAYRTTEGAHTWRVWIDALHDFAPLLFQ